MVALSWEERDTATSPAWKVKTQFSRDIGWWDNLLFASKMCLRKHWPGCFFHVFHISLFYNSPSPWRKQDSHYQIFSINKRKRYKVAAQPALRLFHFSAPRIATWPLLAGWRTIMKDFSCPVHLITHTKLCFPELSFFETRIWTKNTYLPSPPEAGAGPDSCSVVCLLLSNFPRPDGTRDIRDDLSCWLPPTAWLLPS